MHGLFAAFLFTLPLVGLAGVIPLPLKRRNTPPKFALEDLYQGKNFFDGWQFDSFPDPTHGNVNYLNQNDAFAKHLAFVQPDNTTVLAVDDTSTVPVGGNRNSVRISTTKTYNGGLFIGDFFAMPHGCGVWPAYWSVGPDWPNGGEIDVVEGVNNAVTNQMTLHTSDGCTLTNQTSNPNRRRDVATGNLINTHCAFANGDNSGCAFIDPSTTSHGHGFNVIAGGVFAHLWQSDSIKIWHFPRAAVPQDITEMKPDPSSWPTPQAVFTNSQCDINTHFHDHQLVFDTTLCGDFAGSQYPQSGCPGSCAEAVANPANFKFAKWKINYVAVYQPTS